MWPAFWMLGNNIDTAGWPQSGEIDIMENIGREAVDSPRHRPRPGLFGRERHRSAVFALATTRRSPMDFIPTPSNGRPARYGGMSTISNIRGLRQKTYRGLGVGLRSSVFYDPQLRRRRGLARKSGLEHTVSTDNAGRLSFTCLP